MLHWSQEASTGWTRNSWSGSIAKVEDAPFELQSGRGGRARPARAEGGAGCLQSITRDPSQHGGPSRGHGGIETPPDDGWVTAVCSAEVDHGRTRSYAPPEGDRQAAQAAEEGCGS